jgi:mannose-6-phosphate isomerase
MHQVRGRAQHYAWGDPTAIPDLLDLPPDGQPWAEWWMGTHHLAPSTVDDGRPLQAVAGDLPYLLKLMAAAIPLSLQTHPDRARAEAGFAGEDRAGIAVDAPNRIYRDRLAKPELLCAIEPFDTLSGFRPVRRTVEILLRLGAAELASLLQHQSLADAVGAIYRREFDVTSTLAACRRHDTREAALVNELTAMYPDDPSVVVTLLLNRVLLAPGDAVFLGPGNLHAYLRGFGVEIMANSDNVIRGGLTVKHVDVDQLLEVLDFEPLEQPRVQPVEVERGRWRYDTPDAPFTLWRFELGDEPVDHRAAGRELLLWVTGDRRGECDYLDPEETVTLEGPGTVFRATEHAG